MASNFSIESVSATPTFATSNWNGIVNNAVGQHSVIWDTTRSYDNGVNGSTNPVTIKYPINSTLVPVGLRASFQATAPVPGQRNGYVVQASLNNTIILQSQPGGITAGGSQNISVIEMLLVNPNPVTAPLPIRQSGNFQFQLVITAGTIQTRVPATQSPRLEVAFVHGPCPTGDRSPSNHIVASLGGVYPVGLLRLFFPSVADLATAPQSADPIAWYVQRAVSTIWNYGGGNGNPNVVIPAQIQYAVGTGVNSYGVSTRGRGTFQLSRWMRGQFQSVNCQDLAAIAQLSCNILVTPTGAEVLDSRWIEQEPFGFITRGTLIGWPQYPRCNNPFWDRPTSPSCQPEIPDSQINPQTGYPLSIFRRHSWVEIKLPRLQTATVVDATRGLATSNGTPEYGTNSRVTYLKGAQMQTITTPNTQGNAITASPQNPRGNCMQSPDTDPLLPPNESVLGIGLRAINTTGRPSLSCPTVTPETAYDPMEQLTTAYKLLEDTEAAEAAAEYVTADLSLQSLERILQGQILTHVPTLSEYSVGTTGSEVLAAFKPVNDDYPDSPVHYYVEIKVFLDLKAPLAAAMHRLDGYVNPQDGPRPTEDRIGNLSYASAIERFFIRNNVFVRIFADKLPPTTGSHEALFVRIAGLLNTHMDGSLRNSKKLFIPTPKLHKPPPETVRVGELFTLCLDDESVKDTLLDKSAQVSDPSIVQWQGPKYSDGRFEFMALKPGGTLIAIALAHAKMLLPEVIHVKIVVVSPE